MPDNNDRAAASEPGDQSAHDDEATGGDQPSPDPADLHSARSDIPPADELDAQDRQSRLIASRCWGWSKTLQLVVLRNLSDPVRTSMGMGMGMGMGMALSEQFVPLVLGRVM
ncbi:hypothetical protein [Nocardia cyriacigeorgica]|uniref:hypothetical protein n=1 Tax=Nocardia cyriacigeorgica TaxID=135487 RepID=UPI0013D4B7D2|nr:hypothetical protein [Nocardia cyriacigeorgica]NEW29402.1 hypothetical protein [Nocardia cyriacigeorgica]